MNQAIASNGSLLRLLRELNYSAKALDFQALERRLLQYSNGIRFDDDLTLIEMSLTHKVEPSSQGQG